MDAKRVDSVKQRLRDCPNRPNCVSTLATRTWQRAEPLRFDCPTQRAIDIVATVMSSLPRTRVIERDDNYLHATCTSRWLRFVDDVEFIADPTQNCLHFRSASRLGYSDLGVNRRRMTLVSQRLLEWNEFSLREGAAS